MLTRKRNLVIAFFAVLLFSFFINELNLFSIRNQTDKSNEFLNKALIYNQTIDNIDNCWYLPQIKNYMAGKGFTCDTSDYKYAVRRTPVYPMFYGMHYLLFGEKNSFLFIKITQTFLFALAAIAFLLAVFYLTNNKKIAWLAFLFYGFNPTLISYTYFTITESLSPALLGFMLYFFAKGIRFNSSKNWFFAGVFFSLGALCRPTIFIFGGSIAIAILFLYKSNFKQLLKHAIAVGLAVSLFFIPYVIRNYIVSKGDLVLLEKYYDDPMSYGLQNIEFRRWISSWMNPADYNSERVSNKMSTNVINNADKNKLLDSLITTIPQEVYASYDKKTIREIYESMYTYYQYKFLDVSGKNIDSAALVSKYYIKERTDAFIKNHPVQYYVLTPMKIIKSVVVQSNSATLTFLDNYQKNKVKYLVKLMLVLLNVFLFFSLIGNLLYIKKYFTLYAVIILFVGINVFYILVILRYFETRYLIPVFPFLYISGAIFLVETYNQLKKRLNF